MFPLVPADPGIPGQRATKRLCVFLCVTYPRVVVLKHKHNQGTRQFDTSDLYQDILDSVHPERT